MHIYLNKYNLQLRRLEMFSRRQETTWMTRGSVTSKNTQKTHYEIPEWVKRKREGKERYMRNNRFRSYKGEDCLINADDWDDEIYFYGDEDSVVDDPWMRMRDG